MQKNDPVVGYLALALGVATLVLSARAEAYCRTTTCRVPADFAPSPTACLPDDFEDEICAKRDPPQKVRPLWWRNRCVGYSLNANASRKMAFDDASLVMAQAFSKWTSASCPSTAPGATCDDGGSCAPVSASSRVSIDLRDLGPTECDVVKYFTGAEQPNQNAIIFRDETWPHADPTLTLALTTVNFNKDSGEIYDADMEINTANHRMSTGDNVPADGYDFLSIMTHETGHFLGLAHSGDPLATMYARYESGNTKMRNLTTDDIAGICAVYPPDGTRAVHESIDGGGVPGESCNPEPRHGFGATCAETTTGCQSGAPVNSAGSSGAKAAFAPFAALACLAFARARRRKARVRG